MDADRAARASLGDVGDGGDGVASSPMDVLADMFRRKYTLPVFLVSTASIFLLVHLAGGPNDNSFARYDRGGGGGGGSSSSSSSSSTGGDGGGGEDSLDPAATAGRGGRIIGGSTRTEEKRPMLYASFTRERGLRVSRINI